MTASKRNPSLQDVQIVANVVNDALVEAAPTFLHVGEFMVREMGTWLGDRNRIARLAEENRGLRQKVQERHQRPLLPSNQPSEDEFWPSLK